MFVVFDLDGTLADITHRLHYIQKDPPDWQAFFDACEGDKPIFPMLDTLDAFLEAGDHVEIWSGRSDVVRRETEAWLADKGVDASLLTRMRPEGDHRPDVELKRSWLREFPENRRPGLIFDDRKSVVDMWRSEGVMCAHVAEGDF